MSKFNNKQVARIWARDQYQSAKGNNFYCEEGVIYSYGSRFPIARFITAPNGERCVLFTNRTRSQTTAKHKRLASSAAALHTSFYQVIVEDVLRDDVGREALEIANQAIQTESDRLSRARIVNTDFLKTLQRRFNKIIDLFALNQPKIQVEAGE